LQFSLIVPCFNNLAITQQFLRSLLAYGPLGPEVELIFVDDASTDDTPQWMDSLVSPFLRVVKHAANAGFACAMNSGVSAARGEFLVLLNNDLVLTKGWFDPFSSLANNWQSNFGVIGNVQLRVADGMLDHAGITLTEQGGVQHVNKLPDTSQQVSCHLLTGACMMLTKRDFLKHGGFDTAYLNGVEDLELCLQLLAVGKKNYLLPDSVIYHHVSASRRSVNQNMQDVRNLIRLYTRWQDELVQLHQQAHPGSNSRKIILEEQQRLKITFDQRIQVA
jgi:O-antigen biosynthesis protein